MYEILSSDKTGVPIKKTEAVRDLHSGSEFLGWFK